MNRFVALFLLAATAFLSAEPLAQGDRDYTLSALYASRKQFLDTVSGLTPQQWNFKAGPDRWSIAEIAEHLALSEEMLPQIAQKAAASPRDAEKQAKLSNREKDAGFLKSVPDRSTRVQAPEPLKPSGKFATPQAAVDAFRASRDANLKFIRETQTELRGHFAPHPMFGDLDALQWYLLMAAHTERHVAQMKEAIETPGFPKQ